jgi:peptidoglycan hydrolase-like protein with peptidoglycan-binding domain
MNPLVGLGGIGLAVWGGIQLIKKLKKPTASDYQAVTTSGPEGTPVTVATPVADVVTPEQIMGEPSTPPSPPGPVASVAVSIPGEGETFTQPGSVQVTAKGDVLQMAPIVVTTSGSASIAVSTTLDVQRGLNTLGCTPKLVEDGKLGPKTTAAIQAFQKKAGIAVDGVAGPATKAALSNALSSTPGMGSTIGATVQNSNPASGVATTPTGVTIDTTVALKMSTLDIQRALNVAGASPKLVEDGKTGPKTVAAIKSFQTAHGLKADGIAGAKTKTALALATSQAGVKSVLQAAL